MHNIAGAQKFHATTFTFIVPLILDPSVLSSGLFCEVYLNVVLWEKENSSTKNPFFGGKMAV
jgi:hypothetical protein